MLTLRYIFIFTIFSLSMLNQALSAGGGLVFQSSCDTLPVQVKLMDRNGRPITSHEGYLAYKVTSADEGVVFKQTKEDVSALVSEIREAGLAKVTPDLVDPNFWLGQGMPSRCCPEPPCLK